jgi:hypothetical protein
MPMMDPSVFQNTPAPSPEKMTAGQQPITTGVVPIAKMGNKHKVDGIVRMAPVVALDGRLLGIMLHCYQSLKYRTVTI